MSIHCFQRLGFVLLAVSLGAACLLNFGSAQAQTAWVIRKTAATAVDEKNYSEFVRNIGKAVERGECHSFASCIRSSANTYRGSDPKNIEFGLVDCGRLAYALRSYFAWKNGLPFSFVSDVVGDGGDLRYSPGGNRPVARSGILNSSPNSAADGLGLVQNVIESVFTAMYRYHPSVDALPGQAFPDFYPVKIDRASIVPGTVIYDPNGHAATVYDVLADGRVKYIDAHPDNSMTHGTYDQRFVRSRPGMGAGFKRWRPLELVGALKVGDEYIGGRIVGLPNSRIADFSDEQFYGTDISANPGKKDSAWSQGRFQINGTDTDYYEFVRMRLAIGDLQYSPPDELRTMMKESCDYFKDRVNAVRMSLDRGILHQEHPDRLPNNIYGTDGDWELYSTPSRDAELKTSLKANYDQVAKFIEWKKTGSNKIKYAGSLEQMVSELRQVYAEQAASCQITYTHPDGSTTTLGYDDLIASMFAMSFDPYHCPALRWGAPARSKSGEMENGRCTDNANKMSWYVAEQSLRNQIDRTYDAKMGWSLGDLQRPGSNIGVAQPPEFDIKKLLEASATQSQP